MSKLANDMTNMEERVNSIEQEKADLTISTNLEKLELETENKHLRETLQALNTRVGELEVANKNSDRKTHNTWCLAKKLQKEMNAMDKFLSLNLHSNPTTAEEPDNVIPPDDTAEVAPQPAAEVTFSDNIVDAASKSEDDATKIFEIKECKTQIITLKDLIAQLTTSVTLSPHRPVATIESSNSGQNLANVSTEALGTEHNEKSFSTQPEDVDPDSNQSETIALVVEELQVKSKEFETAISDVKKILARDTTACEGIKKEMQSIKSQGGRVFSSHKEMRDKIQSIKAESEAEISKVYKKVESSKSEHQIIFCKVLKESKSI